MMWSNFQSISLLSLDIKLLAKSLVTLLSPIFSSLITKDQVGFIPLCQARNKISKAIHAVLTQCIPTYLPYLGIRKAFKSVSWPYLHFILCHWGFRTHFLTWVTSLFYEPQAYLEYDLHHLDVSPMHRDTRQGCPLSPLLFALAIEP